ncbi:MAG: glycosyltransferase family 4 protein [Thermoplasmata archaeon]|nr:glycosyltransferase family 4 protein [Thermoplasmata archaeon]
MRFVDVNPYFYPHYGGIETRMHDTARLLAARGHDVTILTGRLPDTPEEERTEHGYRIVRLPSRLINVYNPPYISSRGVLEALVSMDPDVVNYNYRWAPSYNKDLKKYDGGKVFTYHNMWGEGVGIQARLSEFNDDRFRPTLETFDHIVCVSDYVRDDLTRRGIPESMTTTIPTCMDMPEPRDLPEGDFILSLGRLVGTKGLDNLIDAMPDIDCRLVMCGKGPERKKLEKRIAKLGLEDRVEMRGYVSEEEKDRLIDTCRLFVMPSLFESFGLAALEVMSHGKPLVYSSVNGLPETVGEGGIPVPAGDPKAIADAVNAMLSDDGMRAEKGRLARAQAETFTWDRHIGRLEAVLRGVAEGSETDPSHR